MQVRVGVCIGSESVCVCVAMYLIKRTTCVVCSVCISLCGAIGDMEVGGKWVGAQGVAH